MMNTIQNFSDPTLPWLATALDCAAMRSIFAAKIAQINPALRLLDCQIERVKYKPGKGCLIAYRVCLCNSAEGQMGREQLICARSYPAGESPRRYERALAGATVATEWGLSLLHLPELSMVAWFFPNEPKLRGLPRLLDQAHLQRETLPAILSTLFEGSSTGEWQIERMTHTMVHYAPEHTCTVRVQVEACHDTQLHTQLHTQSSPQSLVFYGKTYYNDDGAETHRLMHELWNLPAGGTLRLAQPLGYDPQQRILWQRGLDGQPLIAFESQPASFERYLRRAAEAVSTLHQSPARSLRTTSMADSLAKLTEIRTMLSQFRPECQAQSERIIDCLFARAALIHDEPTALLHGDLHLQNFLVHEETIALIDMDNLVNGSPWQDVGSFVAGLHYRGLLRKRPVAETERLIASFCAAYAATSAWHDSSDAVRWYTAAALINERVYRTISRWKGGDPNFIDALLDCAERVIGV